MTAYCPTDRVWQELTAILDELNSVALDLCVAARTPEDANAAAIIHQMARDARRDAYARCPAVARFVGSSASPVLAMLVRS